MARLPYITNTQDGVLLDIYVQPKAKASAVSGYFNARLKLKIAGPPVDGKANQEVCRYLSEVLGVRASNVKIISGLKSRNKRVLLQGVHESLVHALTFEGEA